MTASRPSLDLVSGTQHHLPLFIEGEFCDARDGRTYESYEPRTGRVWASVAEAGPDDVNAAVASARRAFEGPWGAVSPADRARLLWRMAETVDANQETLARVESRDNGKAIRETRAEIANVVRYFEYFAGLCQGMLGETMPQNSPAFIYTRREPVGVVGAIIPWNSPLVMLAWKLCPALAAGNSIVVKPATYTPASALLFASLIQELELPAGTVNILPGEGGRAGGALVSHADVDKIAFTGSTEVGQSIARQAADTLKLVTFELGGKSPNIIFADADLDEAINRAVFGIFSAAGQTCMAASRTLVERSIMEEFLERFIAKSEAIRVGDPLEESTQMGPQVSSRQLETIERYVEIGMSEGATVAAGGRRPSGDGLGDGYFYTPTILCDVDNSMRVAREEIFGPVTAIIEFEDEGEAIAKANDSPYGLSGGVWTRDIKKGHRVAHALRMGLVWVNNYRTWNPLTPFGGYKMSGYGRENGPHVLDHYTQLKTVWTELQDQVPDWYAS